MRVRILVRIPGPDEGCGIRTGVGGRGSGVGGRGSGVGGRGSGVGGRGSGVGGRGRGVGGFGSGVAMQDSREITSTSTSTNLYPLARDPAGRYLEGRYACLPTRTDVPYRAYPLTLSPLSTLVTR